MDTSTARHATALAPWASRAPLHPFAGVIAGLAGAITYLLAQLVFAGALESGDFWLPLERIAAMLLGADALDSNGFDINLAGIGLLVHFTVAIVYGRVIDAVVRDSSMLAATLLGAATGVALYAVAFGIVAPFAFPWFEDSPGLITAFDHLLFGATAGFACARLRRAWPLPPQQ